MPLSGHTEITEIRERVIRAYRLNRIRKLLAEADLAGIVVFDPTNLRYASGSRNMQVWTMHNVCRYAFVATDGPVVLFDLPSTMHLSNGLETIDERRPSLAWDFMAVDPRAEEMAARWAGEIAALLAAHGGGKGMMERARAVKSPAEVESFVGSLRTTEAAIGELRTSLVPGMTEQEAMAIFVAASLKRGGEYQETRLFTSGPRTNPWFQETSDRQMLTGDLFSFDTDMIGPGGWYTDLSRSFIVGHGRPSDDQRRFHDLARQQLIHNAALPRPGVSFVELSQTSFRLPDACLPNRYADIAHGCGLGVEYPLIWYAEDAEWGAYNGLLEAGMIVCVERYVGVVGGREGVKLEEPVLVTDQGRRILSRYPLADDFA